MASVAHVFVNKCDLHQHIVAAAVNGGRRVGGAPRHHFDVVVKVVEEAHAIQVTHSARLALFEIEVHASR